MAHHYPTAVDVNHPYYAANNVEFDTEQVAPFHNPQQLRFFSKTTNQIIAQSLKNPDMWIRAYHRADVHSAVFVAWSSADRQFLVMYPSSAATGNGVRVYDLDNRLTDLPHSHALRHLPIWVPNIPAGNVPPFSPPAYAQSYPNPSRTLPIYFSSPPFSDVYTDAFNPRKRSYSPRSLFATYESDRAHIPTLLPFPYVYSPPPLETVIELSSDEERDDHTLLLRHPASDSPGAKANPSPKVRKTSHLPPLEPCATIPPIGKTLMRRLCSLYDADHPMGYTIFKRGEKYLVGNTSDSASRMNVITSRETLTLHATPSGNRYPLSAEARALSPNHPSEDVFVLVTLTKVSAGNCNETVSVSFGTSADEDKALMEHVRTLVPSTKAHHSFVQAMRRLYVLSGRWDADTESHIAHMRPPCLRFAFGKRGRQSAIEYQTLIGALKCVMAGVYSSETKAQEVVDDMRTRNHRTYNYLSGLLDSKPVAHTPSPVRSPPSAHTHS